MASRARAKKIKKPNLRQTAFTRFTLIVAVLVLWMGGIGVRLVHLQVTQHEQLKEHAEIRRGDAKAPSCRAARSMIRNHRALAMSVRIKTLYVDATEIDDTKADGKNDRKGA